jgi:hypothetical protein
MAWVETDSLSFTARHESEDAGSAQRTLDALEDVRLYTAIIRDISQRKAQERKLQYQATHDQMTGLANRWLFVDRLEHHRKDRFPTKAVYGRTPEPSLRLITCSGTFDERRGQYPSNLIVFASTWRAAARGAGG